MNPPIRLHGRHAVKVFLSSEMKTRLVAVSEALDRPLSDVCRHLMWMALPLVEGLHAAQERGTQWWLNSIVARSGTRTGRIEDIS